VTLENQSTDAGRPQGQSAEADMPRAA